MYGKSTETAIAAMSRLAEIYDEGATRLSAVEIADTRGLQRPFVAKVLTSLSQAGLVKGSRGPGGGFTLARHPKTITINDVFTIFEREDENEICPFGGGICGEGDGCPIHEKLTAVQTAFDKVLNHTTFEVFRSAVQDQDKPTAKPRKTTKKKKKKKKRESYRAQIPRKK